jgi:hypothetical protein
MAERTRQNELLARRTRQAGIPGVGEIKQITVALDADGSALPIPVLQTLAHALDADLSRPAGPHAQVA